MKKFKSAVYPNLTREKIEDRIDDTFTEIDEEVASEIEPLKHELQRLYNMRETIEMENLVYDFYKKYTVIDKETGEEQEYYQ